MPDVRILPEIISNKIAAGEVVERPVSVVKELVENALDAGATQIIIEVVKGGRDLIRVTDNGHGMTRDNALLSIERYATSKITKDDDLFAIRSFGFRGEALPSMASVSKFTLVSRAETSDTATTLAIEGGRLRDVTEVGAPIGTLVEVRDLYFNTPARRKFLKSINTEMGHIADAVSSIALAFPNTAFQLIHNGRTVRRFTDVDTLHTRVAMVLGCDEQDALYSIDLGLGGPEGDLERLDEIRIRGFIGAPSLNRSSGSRILFFVNKRVVSDRTLVSALLRGYRGRIMKGRYPAAAIFIDMPYDQVDVNVHPAKLQVRFLNPGTLFARLSAVVHQALFENEKRSKAVPFEKVASDAPETPHRRSEVTPSSKAFNSPFIPVVYDDDRDASHSDILPDQLSINESVNELAHSQAVEGEDSGLPGLPHHSDDESSTQRAVFEEELFQWHSPSGTNGTLQSHPDKKDSTAEYPERTDHIEQWADNDGVARTDDHSTKMLVDDTKHPAPLKSDFLSDENCEKNAAFNYFSSLHIVGQVFDTYIVAQSNDEMVLIDQHAAHERVVFEKLRSRSEQFRPPSQRLMVPEVIELNYKDVATAHKIVPGLLALGIEVEHFGDSTFLVKSVPAIIDDKEIKGLVLDIIDTLAESGLADEVPDLVKGNENSVLCEGAVEKDEVMGGRDWLEDVLLLISCHTAVRANYKLENRELSALLSDLDRCESPFHCPHGRPIVQQFSQKELEKRFKRTGA